MASDSSIDVKRQVDAVFSIANSLRGTYQSDKYKDVIILDRYEKLRQELLSSGDLVKDGDDGRLMKTVSFSTPSGAADFVLGGSNNGWIEWKDSDRQTIDALYRK